MKRRPGLLLGLLWVASITIPAEAGLLGPTKPSQLVAFNSLLQTPGGCGTGHYEFISLPTITTGQVLILTSFSWIGHYTPAPPVGTQASPIDLFTTVNGANDSFLYESAPLVNSFGDLSVKETISTGLVVHSGQHLCLGEGTGTLLFAIGSAQGYFAHDN